MALSTWIDGFRTRAGGPPVVAFLGDSFLAGSSDVIAPVTVDRECARALGVVPVTSAQGGTGYLSTGQNNDKAFGAYGSDARLNLLAGCRPDLLVVVGSINDDDWDQNASTRRATVRDAAAKTFDAIRAKMPRVPVVVVGAQPSGASRSVAAAVMDNVRGVRDAVAARGDGFAFVDWLGPAASENVRVWSSSDRYAAGDVVTHLGAYWRAASAPSGAPADDAAWQCLTSVLTGTGTAAAPTGDGTRDVLLQTDATHPTSIGSQALGAALASKVVEGVGVLSASGWLRPAGTPALGLLSPRPEAPEPVFPSGGGAAATLAAKLLAGPSTVAYAGYEYKDGSTRGGTSTLRATEAYTDGWSAVHLDMWRCADGGSAAAGGRFVPSASWQLLQSSGTLTAIYSSTLEQLKALALTSGQVSDLESLANALPKDRPVVVEYGPASNLASPSATILVQEPAFWDEVVQRFGADRVVALTWAPAQKSRDSLKARHPDVKHLVCMGSTPDTNNAQAYADADAVSGDAASFSAQLWRTLAAAGKPVWAHNCATADVVTTCNARLVEAGASVAGRIAYNKAALGL